MYKDQYYNRTYMNVKFGSNPFDFNNYSLNLLKTSDELAPLLSDLLNSIANKVKEAVNHLAFGDQFRQLNHFNLSNHSLTKTDRTSMNGKVLLSEIEHLEKKIESIENEISKIRRVTNSYGEIQRLLGKLSSTLEDTEESRTKIAEVNKLSDEFESKYNLEELSDNLIELQTNQTILLKELQAKKKEFEPILLNYSHSLKSERFESLQKYRDSLSNEEKVKLIFMHALNQANIVGTLILQKLIHPATVELTKKNINEASIEKLQDLVDQEKDTTTMRHLLSIKEKMQLVNQDVIAGRAERIHFYTKDHQQLDGCIIYGKGEVDKSKPVMLMSQGNFMTYEAGYQTAKAYADKHNVNVALYNPRGVGNSLGTERNVKQAVEDCKAFIKFTSENYCSSLNAKGEKQIDFNKLAVYGHSLGGGISAEALKELILEGFMPATGVGLYINHHSFSSLSGYTTTQVESKTAPYFKGKFARIALNIIHKILSFSIKAFEGSDLDASKVLQKHQIANQSIIVTGEKDTMMTGLGRLRERLQAILTQLEKEDKKLVFINANTMEHNDEDEYAENLPSIKDYISMDNSSKRDVSTIELYNQLIDQWAHGKVDKVENYSSYS